MAGEVKHAKIGIEQSYADSDETDVEFPWADDLGNNRYQLKNFPFYAYGLSYDDIVEALPRYDDDPYPYFTRIIKKSGHRTIRLMFDESVKTCAKSQEVLDQLAAMDCGYEGTNGERFFVINIQPHCDFDSVCYFLNDNDVPWEYADPTREQLHNEDE